MSILSVIKSHRKKSIAIAIVGILFLAAVVFMTANKIAPVSWGWWGNINNTNGTAIDGYDAVSYHLSGLAEQGSAENSYVWKDVNWYFTSDENKALFIANPEKYIPEYGGYCAYAVSKGVTADSNPNSWILEEGRLYLLADDDVKVSWVNEKEEGIVKQADENWLKR